MSDLRVTPRGARARATPSFRFAAISTRSCSAREQRTLFRTARATSATSWRCPRSATTTPCRRKARAACWCARRQRRRAAVQRLPAPPGHDAARAAARPAANIVCPLHRWTYDLDGQLLGAPHFARRSLPATSPTTRCRPGTACCSRRRNGSRDVAADLARARPARRPRFHAATCSTASSARVRLQLEDLHRGLPRGLPRRARSIPGLGSFVTCDDLRWEFGAALLGADGRRRRTSSPSPGSRRLPQVARRRARLPRGPLRRPGAAPRRDLADLLPGDHGRVVPARAGRLDAGSRRARRRRSTSSSSTTPRRSPRSSASSSRPSRPPTWKPAPRTTRSPCAWTPAGAP